jgi:hypothetical protein
MRVYLPVTLPLLGDLVAQRFIDVSDGYAVTPGLTEWYASGDTEELEWAASVLAARASLRLLAGDPGSPPRRAVLAVDLADEDVERGTDEGDGRGRVHLRSSVAWKSVAAALIDSPDAVADVTAARDSLAAADAGDEDAAFTVEAAEGHDLLWFATQEIGYL